MTCAYKAPHPTEVLDMYRRPGFYVGVGNLNVGPHETFTHIATSPASFYFETSSHKVSQDALELTHSRQALNWLSFCCEEISWCICVMANKVYTTAHVGCGSSTSRKLVGGKGIGRIDSSVIIFTLERKCSQIVPEFS